MHYLLCEIYRNSRSELDMAVNRNFVKGQHVLVRDFLNAAWVTSVFDTYRQDGANYPYAMISGNSWKYCIPRNSDTEPLIGTSKFWSPDQGIVDYFDFSFGDLVMVRDHDGQLWRLRYFDHQSSDGLYPYYTDNETSWKQCIPYVEEYKHILNTVMCPTDTVEEYSAMFKPNMQVLVRRGPFEAWTRNEFEHIVLGATSIEEMRFVTNDGNIWEHCIPLHTSEYNNNVYIDLIQQITDNGFTIVSGDQVLVRDSEDDVWVLRTFMGKRPSDDSMQYLVDDDVWWEYCIAYNDQTKHLLGSDDEFDALVYNSDTGQMGYSDECMIFSTNDQVLCRDNSNHVWKNCTFQRYETNAVYPYITDRDNYAHCVPYCEDTNHLLGTKNPYTSNPYNIRPYDIVCYSFDYENWYVGQFSTFTKDANHRYDVIDKDGDKIYVKYIRPYYHHIDYDSIINKQSIVIDDKTGFIFVQGQKILVRDHDDRKWEGPKYFSAHPI